VQPIKVGNTGAAIMQRRSSIGPTRSSSAPALNGLPKLMTVGEVAAYFKVSNNTVYRMVETRIIPFYKISGLIRFFESEIVSFLESQRVKPKEEWFLVAPHKSHKSS